MFLMQQTQVQSTNKHTVASAYHFNKRDDSSFKMEVALFINSHYWLNTINRTKRETKNLNGTHGYTLKKGAHSTANVMQLRYLLLINRNARMYTFIYTIYSGVQCKTTTQFVLLTNPAVSHFCQPIVDSRWDRIE